MLVERALEHRGGFFDAHRETFRVDRERQHGLFAQRHNGLPQALPQGGGAGFVETREGQLDRLAPRVSLARGLVGGSERLSATLGESAGERLAFEIDIWRIADAARRRHGAEPRVAGEAAIPPQELEWQARHIPRPRRHR